MMKCDETMRACASEKELIFYIMKHNDLIFCFIPSADLDAIEEKFEKAKAELDATLTELGDI